MKSSELVVGESYAYESHKGATLWQVTLLETGVKIKPKSYSSYRGTTGVKVKRVDGVEFEARPQQIVRLWSEQAVLNKEEEEAQARLAQWTAESQARQARMAFAVHKALEAAGHPVKDGYCYQPNKHAALVAAGFEVVEGSGPGSMQRLKSTVYALDDLMQGKLPVAQLATLVGVEY